MIAGRTRRVRAVRRCRLLIPPLDDLHVIHGGLEGRFRCWRHEHGTTSTGEAEEGTESWDDVDGT
jgi:hypothetical protein